MRQGLASVSLAGIVFFAACTHLSSRPDEKHSARADDPDARLRREWEMLRDPKTGKIPSDIERLEQEFARSLPTIESLRARPFGLDPVAQTGTWTSRGPNNIGGRTRALAYDVSDLARSTILAGGVSGGIWRSTNGGASWTETLGSSQLHSITCLRQDTRAGKTNTWYAGTGEFSGNSASGGGAFLFGNGIYKSTDNGVTWSFLSSTSPDTPQSPTSPFQAVFDIAIDVSNTTQDEVYAATEASIHRSVDGGATWSQVLGSWTSDGPYTDVAVTSTGVVYATISSGGSTQGLYRSPGGTTWTNITPAAFPTNYGRIVIGVAPSSESIVYFFGFTLGSGTSNQSFWKYDGTTFVNRSANLPSDVNTQGGYDAVVTVRPNDPNTVFIGGTSLWRSTDAFASTAHTAQIGGYGCPGCPSGDFNMYRNHHPDVHSVVFQPGSSLIALSGDDGGVQRTADITASTVTWTSLNNGYLVSQFYTAAIDEGTSGNNIIIGGLQDQGWYHNAGASAAADWLQVGGADGTVMAVASGRTFYYGEIQDGYLFRVSISDSGVVGTETEIDPSAATGKRFVNPYVLDANNSSIMYYVGGSTIWRNGDLTNATGTNGWVNLVSSTVSNSTISALAVSKTPANRLYYGTSDGKVYRIDGVNSGSSPTRTDLWTGKGLPASAYVSCITVDPANADRAVIVFSNYSVVSLYYTTNAGSSWTAVSGNLEQNADGSGNGPSCRWATIVGGSYYVGTSTGLYSTGSINGASTVWALEGSTTIGNVVVNHLAARQSDGLIVAATHGKGIFSSGVSGGSSGGTCGSSGVATVAAAAVPSPDAALGFSQRASEPNLSTTTVPANSPAEVNRSFPPPRSSAGMAPTVLPTPSTMAVLVAASLLQQREPVSTGAHVGAGNITARAELHSSHSAVPSQPALEAVERKFAAQEVIATAANLTAYQPSGWSDALVLTTTSGSRTDATSFRATDTIYVNFGVINSGGTATPTRFYTAVQVDGSTVWNVYTDPPLSPNYYTTGIDLSIGTLSAGTHTIRINIDSTGAIAESNEGDNTYSKTITVTSLANLTAYQPSGWSDRLVVTTTVGSRSDAATIGPTDPVYASFGLINNGGTDTAARFYTALKVDGATVWNVYTDPPLSPNYYTTGTDLSLGTLSAGTHTISMAIDSTGAIAESNEGDNTFSKTITVVAALPNLTTYQPPGWSDKLVVTTTSGSRTDATTIRPSDTVYVNFGLINNGSSSTASRFYTAVKVDGTTVWNVYTDPPLDPTYYTTGTDLSVGTLSAGTHTISITIDSTGAIAEGNEGDNTYSKSITVVSLPNLTAYQPPGWSGSLVVTTTSGSRTDASTIRPSDTVYVNFGLINNGSSSTASRFYTAVKVDGTTVWNVYTDPPLDPNYYTTGTDLSVGTLSAGAHTISITIDSTGAIAEGNESDNVVTKTITVSAGIDIAAQRAYLRTAPSGGGSEVDPAPVGQAVYFHADYQIIGASSPVTVTMRAMLDGVVFCACQVANASGTFTSSCAQPWTATAGSHTLQWDFDYTNSVAETNESNNSVSKVYVSNDTTAPSTSITAPANNSTVSGTTTITATASDDVGVTSLEIDIDGSVKTSNSNSSSLTYSWNTTQYSNGQHALVSKAADAAGHLTTSSQVTVTVSNGGGGLSAPANVVATAASSSQVSITWTAVGGASSYRIYRSSNQAGYSLIGLSNVASFSDTGLAGNTAYLYQVRAVDSSNNGGPASNIDLATTVIFTEDPIVARSTGVKAAHITELRTAVNAVRTAAGLSPVSFTDSVIPGIVVKRIHLAELRSGLDEARSSLGLSALVYTDVSLPSGTIIKGIHIAEIRSGVR